MMGSRGAFLAFLVICCVFSRVSATLEDGLPRPKNFLDQPTTMYGPTPALEDNGFPVDCEWYGFANTLYDDASGADCLAILRRALTNATVNPPSKMEPYLYYTLKRLIDANNNSICYQGCFNLGDSLAPGGAPPPLDTAAPPPFDTAAPPPLDTAAPPPLDTVAPPPLTFGVPPVSSVAPVPSLFPGAPPPLDASSPPLAETPASIFPPPPAALTPALSPDGTLLPPPPGVEVPSSEVPVAAPTTPVPPPPGTTGPVLIPNTGAFLQPTSLLSCFIAAVALIANFAAY